MAQVTSARRNTELSLLLLALIVGGGALALVAVARSAEEVNVVIPLIVGFVACYTVAHVVMRISAKAADSLVLPLAAVLNALGLAAVFRLSPDNLGVAQVTWTVVGIVFFIATLLLIRDFRVLARYKYILGFTGLGLLLLPATPFGTEINGAQLWIRFGGLSFQPGELAKICLVIFFAAYLAERKELLAIASKKMLGLHVPDIKHFGPLLVMWGVSLAVMFYEKDLGSSLLFFSIFLVMLYIATARLVYMAFGFLLFLVGAYVGYQTFSHVQLRVRVWLDALNPDLIPNESYQIAQSLFALATGGLFGTGWGQGRPGLIPEAQTDFIFSVIGEELGLLGTAAIVVTFLLLVARGLRVALETRDDFGQLLAAGLTVILGVQTFIILGGVTRLLPLTGITLPFMSYGGSSLLSNFILIALLIRISHQSAAEPDPAHTAEILIGGRR
ncbi:MAG TPA: FtsW/RodA/SpoVE family cell cycle protein [Actinomycetota bacterium]|nr:FtsW/RodA/SpoVE family cell cycle protein [Actinomycetota bacterium]